ncbi:MAG: hypothetical protein KKH68_10400 [Proteobacteria bacterium]|nr:hypothetical protein [Pseudomonadota bacterium]
MIIIPREKPVIQNMNSYYLNVQRLIEHYQGELGAGGIHFKSTVAEGVIFFDEVTILNGVFRNQENLYEGSAAIDLIIENLSNTNFSVAVYQIDPEKVYFWASLRNTEEYYKNLSTDFTDLEGLITKMSSESLTGYIDVLVGDKIQSGIIFFNNGTIIGCSCHGKNEESKTTKENQQLLVQKSKEWGGVFNVYKVAIESTTVQAAARQEIQAPQPSVLDMIQDLLVLFERDVRNNKKIKADFDTLLKRKFVEKVDRYDFLDPFAAEFQYTAGKVQFFGKAKDVQLVRGVVESVYELADDLDMLAQVRKNLVPWYNKYSKEIEKYDIGI